MKKENGKVVFCPSCGENVGLPTKRGCLAHNAAFSVPLAGKMPWKGKRGLSNKESSFTTPLPRYAALPPQGGQMTAYGFTLIELLVVVLIIGILAAVAVPQYKLAVLKSHFAKIRPVISALQKAEEVYYLSNGSYTKTINNLDIDHTCSTVIAARDVLACDNNFFIDVLESNGPVISVYYCPGLVATNDSWHNCWSEKRLFNYRMWLNHSEKPNTQVCTSFSTIGTKFCDSFY